MIVIREINDCKTWEDFATRFPNPKTFLQSWYWGDFAQADGHLVWRLGVYRASKLIGVGLVQRVISRRGTFILVPHGPLIDWQDSEALEAFLAKLQDIARQTGTHFIRLNPRAIDAPERRAFLEARGFRLAPAQAHADHCWVLDITPPEEKLMAGFRKVHRYSMRKAAKAGVSVRQSTDPTDLETFFRLYERTVARQHFVPFKRAYIEKQFEVFARSNMAQLFLADFQNEILASAFITFWDSGAFYHHGASSQTHPDIPASHLVMWEAIREAKRRGLKYFNFWGVSPAVKRHDLKHGLTFFKSGFGGTLIDLVPTHDLPLSWRYWLVYGIEKGRQSLRKIR